MMKKSKFVSLSQFASKATGGAYGSGASHATASLPPSSSAGGMGTPTAAHAAPHTPGGSSERKRMTWADRVREKLPPLDANEYEVLWERGVLGVIFLESEKDGIPYVSKATESCISPLVQPGDILKFVNDVRSEKHSFSEFFKILATMKKPVLLRFERPAGASSASGSGSDRAPSPGEAEMLDQRSTSANDISSGGRGTMMKDAAKALAAKVHRSNSLPQSEKPAPQKPVARGTFWRASTAKDLQPAPQTSTPAPKRRDLASPVAKAKYDGDTDTSDSPNEPLDEDEFRLIEVYWETGSLGLFFGEERGTGYPVVTRSTPGVNPSVHRKVQVNDVLLSANGVRSADFTFEAFFARLQQMSKPVKLVFRRKYSPPGTPPLRTRKTSLPKESFAVESPTATRTSHLKAATLESEPAASTSRPSRLPPSSAPGEIETRKTITAEPRHAQRNGSLRQDPSPTTKPRAASVETRALMDESGSPSNGVAMDPRSNSPQTRPDIVFLGSPKKKTRPTPPSPPIQVAVNSEPSPREKVEPLQPSTPPPSASSRVPSPQPAPVAKASSPTEKRVRTASGRQSLVTNPIVALGDDFNATPKSDPPAKAMTPPAADTGVTSTPAAKHVEETIEEGVAVGVPVESTQLAAEFRPSAVLANAVLAEVLDEGATQPVDAGSITPSIPIEVGLPLSDTSDEAHGVDGPSDSEDTDDSTSQTSSESESDEGEPLDSIEQEDPDISGDLDSNDILASDPKTRGSIASPKPNKAALNASLAKYRKKSKNSRPLVKLPAINEDNSQTVPLTAPNAVNTSVQVRGRSKPKPSLVDTPNSSTYLVKWKEGRSVGLQLREVRIGKGTFPLVVDVCKEPCCESLKHVCIGDVIVEINGRNCSTMGVKKTVAFLKTSSKTMLLKLRRGPAFLNERVSALA